MFPFIENLSSKIDWYGQPVGVNFKGQSTITSKMGAFFTILTVGLGSAYAISKISQLSNRTDPQINQYIEGMNLFENLNLFNLGEHQF
jgi:hypothetical protein